MEEQAKEERKIPPDRSDAKNPPDSDEEEAQRARARRLRQDIARIKSRETPASKERYESPRDFVERRMRELEIGDKGEATEGSEPD